MTSSNNISISIKKLAIFILLAISIFTFGLAPSVESTGGGNPGNDKAVGRAGESPNGRDFGGGTMGQRRSSLN